MARKKPANASFANAFGALGYCSIVLQWLWAFLITAYPLLMGAGYWTAPSATETTVHEQVSFEMPDPIATLIMVIAVLVIAGVSVYMLAALPKRIGQTGQIITQKAATTLIPIITEHRKISEKKRHKLTVRTVLVMKLLLIAIPMSAPYIMPDLTSIDKEIIAILGLLGVASSSILFGLQYLVAKAMRTPSTLLW